MTDDQIATIRNLRACNVPWRHIAKQMNRTILECRQALGLPEYESTERLRLPWDKSQQTLPFDQ